MGSGIIPNVRAFCGSVPTTANNLHRHHNMLSLLLINISEQSITAILKLLGEEDLDVEHQAVRNKETISEALKNDTNWDVILISENGSDKQFPLLTWLNKQTNLPMIFLAAENNNQPIASAVLQKGARDCVYNTEYERLIPVIKRELNHKKLKERYNETLNSQQFLADIIDITTEEIFIFDATSLQCFNANFVALQNSGYTKEEIFGLTPADFFSEYNNKAFFNLTTPLLDGNRDKISLCTNIKRRNGSIYPAEVHLKKIGLNEKPYIILFSKKISGIWHKVQKLKRQRNLTKQYIRKNNQKEQILVNAAHDMRTSLNTIILSSKIIIQKSDGQLPENCNQLTNTIHYSGNHLINYLDEFFDLSGIEENPEKLNLETIKLESFGQKLYQAFDLISKTEDKIEFNYETDNIGKLQINTNPTYLNRILKNLLSNAFKYTNRGSVTLKVYVPTQKELENIGFDVPKAIAFQVKDTGIGISLSEQKQIFKRYSRGSSAISLGSSGKGLGLDISQKLAEALEGTINIDSEIDSGTTVTLFLPADKTAQMPSANIDHHAEPDINLESSKETINKNVLIVDDNNMQNLAIKEFLKHIFSNCLTAQSKEQAYKIFNQYSVDFIILDYIINDTHSLDLAKKIKDQDKKIPIITYTGKKLNEAERNKIKQYSCEIIKKRTGSHNQLIRTIYSCLHASSKNRNNLFLTR